MNRKPDWVRIIFSYGPPLFVLISVAAVTLHRVTQAEAGLETKADKEVVNLQFKRVDEKLSDIKDDVSQNTESIERIEDDVQDIKETSNKIFIQLEKLNGRLNNINHHDQ